MHTMLVHPNFPSQFGHLAMALSARPGDKVTFLTSYVPQCGELPFDVVTYRIGNQPFASAPSCGSSLQDYLLHAEGVLGACVNLEGDPPDVVLGHATFGTWLYLRSLYNARFVSYYEIIPPYSHTEAFSLRPDYPPDLSSRAVNASMHALNHLHLMYADAAYTPTRWQFTTCPEVYRDKMSVIHDGVDTETFRKLDLPRPYTFKGISITKDTKVVTYLSRNLESFRGFDVFMKAMKIVIEADPNVVVLVVGGTANYYGHDKIHTGGLSFRDYILSQDSYDLERIRFLGTIKPSDLATFWSLSDCNIYLTVPWVLSWSCVQAMSCQAPMLVSDTEPVREVIRDGMNGLVVPFYDYHYLAENCLTMLQDRGMARALGKRGRWLIEEHYSVDVCVPRVIKLLEGNHDA